MIDAIKRALLAGVGAAVITREKAEAALGDLVAQGKVTAQEARVVAEKIACDGRREFDSVSADVGNTLEQILATSVGRAETQLQRLKERLREMQSKAGKTPPPSRSKRRKARRPARARPKRRSV